MIRKHVAIFLIRKFKKINFRVVHLDNVYVVHLVNNTTESVQEIPLRYCYLLVSDNTTVKYAKTYLLSNNNIIVG